MGLRFEVELKHGAVSPLPWKKEVFFRVSSQLTGPAAQQSYCADQLDGQIVGEVGLLPIVFAELEVNYFLLRRLLGVEAEFSGVQLDPSLMDQGDLGATAAEAMSLFVEGQGYKLRIGSFCYDGCFFCHTCRVHWFTLCGITILQSAYWKPKLAASPSPRSHLQNSRHLLLLSVLSLLFLLLSGHPSPLPTSSSPLSPFPIVDATALPLPQTQRRRGLDEERSEEGLEQDE
ncbi:hypothetical protein Droror1_Dr00024220 [Drosera rotundifolia]